MHHFAHLEEFAFGGMDLEEVMWANYSYLIYGDYFDDLPGESRGYSHKEFHGANAVDYYHGERACYVDSDGLCEKFQWHVETHETLSLFAVSDF